MTQILFDVKKLWADATNDKWNKNRNSTKQNSTNISLWLDTSCIYLNIAILLYHFFWTHPICILFSTWLILQSSLVTVRSLGLAPENCIQQRHVRLLLFIQNLQRDSHFISFYSSHSTPRNHLSQLFQPTKKRQAPPNWIQLQHQHPCAQSLPTCWTTIPEVMLN